MFLIFTRTKFIYFFQNLMQHLKQKDKQKSFGWHSKYSWVDQQGQMIWKAPQGSSFRGWHTSPWCWHWAVAVNLMFVFSIKSGSGFLCVFTDKHNSCYVYRHFILCQFHFKKWKVLSWYVTHFNFFSFKNNGKYASLSIFMHDVRFQEQSTAINWEMPVWLYCFII